MFYQLNYVIVNRICMAVSMCVAKGKLCDPVKRTDIIYIITYTGKYYLLLIISTHTHTHTHTYVRTCVRIYTHTRTRTQGESRLAPKRRQK